MTAPAFDGANALIEHHDKLLGKRAQLDMLIANVEKTIALTEGRMTMTDKEKFAGFKQQKIDDNKAKYGKEIREKMGDKAIDKSNKKLQSMSEEQHATVEKLGADDERFTAFYDAKQPGSAEFLRDAVLIYTGLKG